MSKKCYECHGTGVCDCICCALPTVFGRLPGSCQVCKAVAFRRRHAGVLLAADPTDHRNYERHPAADGNKGYWLYLPLTGLK